METTRTKTLSQTRGLRYMNHFLPFSYLSVISSVKLTSIMSILIASILVHLGLPLIIVALLTIILELHLISTHIGLPSTCPNYLNRFSPILFSVGGTSTLLQIHSLLILYCHSFISESFKLH